MVGVIWETVLRSAYVTGTEVTEGNNEDGDVRGIEDLLEALEMCVKNSDADSMASLFCDDMRMIFTGTSGRVRGRDEVAEIWKLHLDKWSDVRLERRETAMRVHGDIAWGSFLWDGEGVSDGKRYRLSGERWSVVLLWTEEGWKFAQAHCSMPYTDWESLRMDE